MSAKENLRAFNELCELVKRHMRESPETVLERDIRRAWQGKRKLRVPTPKPVRNSTPKA